MANSPPSSPSSNDNQQPEDPGIFAQMSMGYDQLVNAIIRPPRAQYNQSMLGPPQFAFAGRQYQRTDFELENERGMKLQCSHWEPVERPLDLLPCVVYLHGNSGSRVEATNVLSSLLSGGATVLAFDFAGSGQSDGEYVSLGHYEKEDLSAIVQFLRGSGLVSTLGLWGRSMGAATALQHGDRDPSIAGMVIDSGFTSLEVLAEELVDVAREQGHSIPGFAVSIAMSMIKKSVKKKAKFKVTELKPIEHVDRCFIPAVFVHGTSDDFIKPHHSEQLLAQYAGDKQLILVDGDHNSRRPEHMLDTAAIFLHNALQIDPACCPDLQGVHRVDPNRPPWRQQQPSSSFAFTTPAAPTPESVAPQVITMVEMGFTHETAEIALLMNHGNVDLALAALLEAEESHLHEQSIHAADIHDAPFADSPVADTPPTTVPPISIGAP